MESNLADYGKPIVPLLDDLTYFLEQYHFTPSLLSQTIKILANQKSRVRLGDEEVGSLEDRGLPSFSGSVYAYDYETLGMIMSEAHSLSLSLKMGLSSIAWLSAVSSINGAVLQWLLQLYRIPTHLSAAFVDNVQLTRQNILRTALTTHFPTFPEKGFFSFGSKLPVVLCTHLDPWIETLVMDVGLPRESIRVGPGALQALKEDEVVVCVLWVLPDPTEPITWDDAQTDALIAYVQKSGVWLHAEGYDTVLMTSLEDASANVIALIADSLIVDASELVQVERFNSFTLFYRPIPRTPPSYKRVASEKLSEEDETLISPKPTIVAPSEALHLELWFAIQIKGKQFLSQLVSTAHSLCDQLYRKLSSTSLLRVLETGEKQNATLHIRFVLPEIQQPQSIPTIAISSSPTTEEVTQIGNEPKSTETSSTPPYMEPFERAPLESERVTEYLFQYVQNSSPTPLPIELKRLQSDGQLYLLWDPMRCYHIQHLARGHVATLSDMLTRQSIIIASTYAQRKFFETEVLAVSNRLTLVSPVPEDHVGLGAIRYRPEFVSVLEEETGKEALRWAEIIDDLNIAILNELLQIHPMYYMAVTKKGEKCLGIHLDSSEMSREKVQYHLQLILETAAHMEADSRFLDRIGELVREGIQEAKEAIERSKLQRTADKGFVRALPIVGRVWNWWSPYKTPAEGASFDLLSTASAPSAPVDKEL